MSLTFKQALVTGGAGFIGSHLTETLAHQGCGVTVLDNLASGHAANLAAVAGRVRFVQGDIRNPADLESATAGCEVVFHLAAVVSVPRTTEDPLGSAAVNETGSLQVLEAARRAGARRVVFASSSAVYGDDPVLPKREDMAPRPLTPYAVQKLAVEYHQKVYTSLYGLEAVSLRFFNVYGPRQDPASPYSGVISIFMTRALSGTAPVIYGDGLQTRDFVFVGDVVQALVSAATVAGRARPGVQRRHGASGLDPGPVADDRPRRRDRRSADPRPGPSGGRAALVVLHRGGPAPPAVRPAGRSRLGARPNFGMVSPVRRPPHSEGALMVPYANVLVTGAAGFIGFHLSKRLLDGGARVVGLDNLNAYYSVKLKEDRLAQLQGRTGFELARLDLADREGMQRLFRDQRFDVVVNLAAQAGVRYSLQNPHAYIDANIVGFINILEGCRHGGVEHLVYASSSSVYGANTRMPFSVHDNVDHPVSLYAATKKANELMAHTYATCTGCPAPGCASSPSTAPGDDRTWRCSSSPSDPGGAADRRVQPRQACGAISPTSTTSSRGSCA